MSPYKKTKRFGRKRFTRKRYPNSKLNYAYNKVRQIAKTYHPEVKKFDVYAMTVNVGTSASVYPLANMGQGDTIITRQGNKILVKYLAIQGYLQHNNTSTIGQYVKIYVMLDKQQVGDTIPTGPQMFESTGVLSYLNAGNVGRFKILKCFKMIVDPSYETKKFNIYKRMSLPIRFNSIDSGDIQKNGLYIVFVSDDNTNKPIVNFNARVGFIDN